MPTYDNATTKVMVIAHGHPDHAKGGGEIAAYNLHKQLNASPAFQSVFLARHNLRELIHGGTPIASTGRPGEMIMHATMPDWFRFSQPDKAIVWRDFRQALETCKPDIVHFHHYLHLGLEFIREVRNFSADIPILLTLHEYYAICHNQGQMVKTDRSLCYESSPDACARCFSQYKAQDFMLRKLFIKSHLDLVDAFISPSQFLKDRYVAWGLPEDKINVIENLLTNEAEPGSQQKGFKIRTHKKQRIRFSFFGQINWFKGLDLLLEAIDALPNEVRDFIRLDINGSGLDQQPKSLKDTIHRQIRDLGDCVNFRGAYTQQELPHLMAESDWMVIPSKWWENSPMVMLEASKHGLPILCSNLGGMAEKVIHGKHGLHFQARRPDSLASAITWATENPEKQAEFSDAIIKKYNADDALAQHIALYQQNFSATENTDVKAAAVETRAA